MGGGSADATIGGRMTCCTCLHEPWVAAQLQLDGKPITLEKFNGMFDQWQLTRAD